MDITITFDNYNGGTEDGVHVYRSDTPMLDASMPAPLATIAAGSTSYVDATVVRGNKYYYRVGIFKGTDETLTPNRAFRAVAAADTGPGPQKLISGDWDLGYFGYAKSTSDLISYANLGTALGLSTAGTALTNDLDWLKVAYKGKVLFVARTMYKYNIAYTTLYSAGAVFGTNDNGLLVPGGATATNQYHPQTINGFTLIPRILKGLPDNAALPANVALTGAAALPTNEYDDILGSFMSPIKYTGDVTNNVLGRQDWDLYPAMGASYGITEHCQQTSGFTNANLGLLRGGRATNVLPVYPGSLSNMAVTAGYAGTTLWNALGVSNIYGGWRQVLELVL
ncbi:hypothetical protein AVU38_gp184 [Ralstonia phage RSL2]|uniref:Virion structural protein n=1 Tax=Ralstonia phage RSL2 TaxID=1585840 RepID=A0A0A8J8Z7_9CAUD|nr:hypothetical protein AVU38_gp184 [Ralstonia phage RSL2]BAQ02712.1 hypothetical protein [Ralstonia phage RSL2]